MDEPSPLLSRWLGAVFTIVFAASVAAVLFASGIGGGLSFGPVLAAALSLATYGALALAGFRRVPLEDRVSWWVAVLVAHAAFGLLSAWLFGFIRSLGLGAALAQAFGGFAPASLVSLIAAPLAALPFRPRLPVWRVARPTQHAWSASEEPAADVRAVAAPAPVPARWAAPPRGPQVPASRPPAAPPPAAAAELPRAPVLRITFARIADQLPPDMLALPPARLAATLREPGHVLVPAELVLPRLHDGAVAVPATVLDDQLPRGAVLASSPEARARWNALRLALPMDEVAAQSPAEDALETAPEPVPAEAPAPPRRLRADEIEAVVAGLAPAGRFEIHARDVEGLGHLLALARDVSPDTVEALVRKLAAVLPSTSGAPGVVTLAVDGVAMTAAVGDGVVLAAATRLLEAPVALMELLVARVAAAVGLEPRRAVEEVGDGPGERSAPAALDLGALGAALDGFGPVVPAVFRDDDRRLDVYVFRPADTAPAPLGRLAAAADAALGGVDHRGPASVSFCAAGRRTELRWATGHAAVLAVSGVVVRAGLARRQVARAAAALET